MPTVFIFVSTSSLHIKPFHQPLMRLQCLCETRTPEFHSANWIGFPSGFVNGGDWRLSASTFSVQMRPYLA